MQVIEAEYEIVTPMFIGGADPGDTPEIRPPSVKGALRFWWRALQWGKCLQDKGNNVEEALHELHRQEAELFGEAVNDKGGGQGLCRIKLSCKNTQGVEKNWPTNNTGAGLIGYGLDSTKTEPHRQAIKKGQFTLSLLCKAKINLDQMEQLKNTLTIWGLLGGLGSRSRRGFGSVSIQRLDKKKIKFNTDKEYHLAIKSVLSRLLLLPDMPIFTSVNKAMKIVQAGHASQYQLLFDQLGAQYQQARINAGKGRNRVPFGLPLAGTGGVYSDTDNRRGSPLLMHIHPIDNYYVAIVSFIPADFHPAYPKGRRLSFYTELLNYLAPMTKVYP